MHVKSQQRHNKDEWHSLLEKFTSHFIWKRLFPALQGCSTRGLGLTLLGAGFLYRILSPTGLVSKLTNFLSSPSYIIVQSPTQYLPITGHRDVSLPLSLEWHVWLSSSGNNCHAVHRSLSSGASVWLYRGILPCPILSAKPAYAYGICNFRIFGMACLAESKVNIQQMAPETRVQSQVKSHQRLKKWYLMPPCLTLSIIRYGSMVKWSNPEKGVAPFPTLWCSSYRKGSFRVTLNYGHQLYLLLYK